LASKKTHDCEWRDRAAELESKLAERDGQFAALLKRVSEIEHTIAVTKRQTLGPKTERMPTPENEAKALSGEPKVRGGHTNPELRKKTAKAKADLPAVVVHHAIAESERRCATCGDDVRPMGAGDRSVEYEWVPGRIEKIVHVVETARCPCKSHYARGPAPVRVQEGSLLGPKLLAKIAVEKFGDATPVYRISKSFKRQGIPMARSTLNDGALLVADVCLPLWRVMFEEIRADAYVQADETSFRTQTSKERSFVWTFLSKTHTAYTFSDRTSETPKAVLGVSSGMITIDGFSSYNGITEEGGRERTGCFSHARRYLFDALPSAPEARDGLDIILELFMMERAVKDRGIAGTLEHLEVRRAIGAPIVERLEKWWREQLPRFEPRSPMAVALGYMRNQWDRLTVFLKDAQVPIHNNASEAALRIIALARKNSLFFANVGTGKRLMVLYSLIATCERHGVNPETYLADVLIRIQDYPAARVAELLPHRWKLTFGAAAT
jgi:transposase